VEVLDWLQSLTVAAVDHQQMTAAFPLRSRALTAMVSDYEASTGQTDSVPAARQTRSSVQLTH